ncbi:hypothetical protein BJX63DRAFT_440101 [Aspergillus granulosus]|uniref:Zn(2)-C6 fungal-type domain-containing protein n=1 Tax=Aspergillus granulosus TaxID=176169 RepID=A0ABR4GY02_9EURO
MDPTSGYQSSKRPPKLRSACNECHAAKVRCSGEKTGCQRCGNLHLTCIFSISRIGKVPGKRSKANRVAAAAAASTSAAPISTATSSMSTPAMSPPLLTPDHSYESPRSFGGRNMPVPATSYPFPQEYPTASLPLTSEATHPHIISGYPQSNPEDLSNYSNLCWATELDQLDGPGLLSPNWELDTDDPIALASTASASYPDLHPFEKSIPKAYASPAEFIPSPQCTIYLQLINSIEQSIQLVSHCRSPNNESAQLSVLESILGANQRFVTTLLQITDNPSFRHTYSDEHLLFSVALDKVICLFSLGYGELRRRMEIHEGMSVGSNGSADRWVRFGAYGIDFLDQVAIGRRAFVEEMKRARLCLGRLIETMGPTTTGRHEELCEEMKRRLDGLMEEFEGDHSLHMSS